MALFHLQFGIHNAFPLTTPQRAVRALEAAVMPGLQRRHGPARPSWPATDPLRPTPGHTLPRHAEGTAPTSPAPASSHWPPDSLPLSHWVLAPSLGEPRPYCCRDLKACPPHSVATVTLGLRMWPCKCCRLQPLVGCGEMFRCPWAAPAPLLLWWGFSHSFSSWRPARS